MMHTTYSHARAHLAELCRQVVDDRELVVIKRRGEANVVLIAADELAGLLEMAHLLKSPKNAQRLLNALARAQSNAVEPSSVESLREELGLGAEKLLATCY